MKCGVTVVGYRTWDAKGPGGLQAPTLKADTPEEAVEKAMIAAQAKRGR